MTQDSTKSISMVFSPTTIPCLQKTATAEPFKGARAPHTHIPSALLQQLSSWHSTHKCFLLAQTIHKHLVRESGKCICRGQFPKIKPMLRKLRELITEQIGKRTP